MSINWAFVFHFEVGNTKPEGESKDGKKEEPAEAIGFGAEPTVKFVGQPRTDNSCKESA